MTRSDQANILDLIKAGREGEAIEILTKPISLQIAAAIGPRSARAALHAAERIFDGDVAATADWMRSPARGLDNQTPIEKAEESEEGLEDVLTLIGQIEYSVYV